MLEGRKKEEKTLHTSEMRMLWWARRKTRLDHVRNVDIWKESREDRARNQMTTEMTEDRKHWHFMVQAGTLRSVDAGR